MGVNVILDEQLHALRRSRQRSFVPPIQLVQLFFKLFQLLPRLTQLAFGGEPLIIGQVFRGT